MNEMLNDLLALQRYADDLARAEQAYNQQKALNTSTSPARTRVALGLVTLATKLQPALSIHVQRQPEAALEAPRANSFPLSIPPVGRLCIGQETR